MARTVLSESDLSAIEAAVREAERRTSGEIYCVVAEQAAHYGETPLVWAAAVALLAPAILLMGGVHVTVPELFGEWDAAQVGAVAESAARRALVGAILLQAVLFATVALVVTWRPVRLAMTPRWVKRHEVRRRAAELFLSKALHLTRERTGVLIFVSLGEHMAEIIADEGINSQVEPGVWDRAMAALAEGLKRGDPAAGFTAAIKLCGEVLAERFPVRPGENPNELPDAVVLLPHS